MWYPGKLPSKQTTKLNKFQLKIKNFKASDKLRGLVIVQAPLSLALVDNFSLTRSLGNVIGRDRSTEGTESEVGSKKKERKNTINTNPIEATSQSLLAHFLHRNRELNLGIAIEEQQSKGAISTLFKKNVNYISSVGLTIESAQPND